MSLAFRVVRHHELTDDDFSGLCALFDAEYLTQFGEWNPEQPYGYARHDVHVIASRGDDTVGHAGWAHRGISVGEREMTIAGVGGVLIAKTARGLQLGEQLMRTVVISMGMPVALSSVTSDAVKKSYRSTRPAGGRVWWPLSGR